MKKPAQYKLIRNRYGYFPSYWDEKLEKYISFRTKADTYVCFLPNEREEAQIWLHDAKINEEGNGHV